MKTPTSILTLLALSATVASGAAFKVTFGAKNQRHGANWSGGIHDPRQAPGIIGWRLHDDDEIRAPSTWDLLLQSVGGDAPAKGVILDIAGPESQTVSLFSRRGDIDFQPSVVPLRHCF